MKKIILGYFMKKS